MKKILWISLFVHSFLCASISDDYHLFQAKKALNNNDINSSLSHYNKIKNKTNEIYYNMGNILYKQKKYEESKQYYKEIKGSKLQSKILHNLGNAYAQTNQPEKAISYYEKALTLKDDPDTKYNLELLKQEQKKQQEGKEKQNKEDKENKDSNSDGKNNKTDDSQQDNNKEQKESDPQNENTKEEQKEQKDEKSTNRSDNEKTQQYDNDTNTTTQEQNTTQQKTQLSDVEEGKWNQKLQMRKINTLMMPIQTKGEKNENINPW